MFSCGSLECKENFLEKLSYGMWTAVLTNTRAKLEPTRCDFCFLCAPLQEVHRSLCKTKNYCSKVCRKADDSVHQVCCKQGDHQVEERKVKIGGQEKVEVADASLKSFASKRLWFLQESPKLLDSSDFKEVLRHTTNVVQKIQLKEDRKLKEVGGVDNVKEVD